MSSTNKLAKQHSMDVPRVTAVDVPFNVKNSEKVVTMLGGKLKIESAVNSFNNSPLELRLRPDPFHHPVQLTVSNTEKVLLKVRIPKESLPADYYENPRKYPIAKLIELNNANPSTSPHMVVPVAIVDRTHLFKAMADFQVTTKNAKSVTDFTETVYKDCSFKSVKNFFDSNDALTGLQDYKNLEHYTNKNHNFPPPPVLSPIKFPFDYKYQKNPHTVAVKDSTGQVRVVSTRNKVTLHTMMLAYDVQHIPLAPPQPLVDTWNKWEKEPPAEETTGDLIIKCVKWLNQIFLIKPIWTRRQLEDIIAPDLRKVLKQAIPYVTYTYTSGPWRFCVIKYGVDPRSSTDYWMYQSEYFKMNVKPALLDAKAFANKVVPQTVSGSNYMSDLPQIKISESLFFTGSGLPATATYQIGDISDPDVTKVISQHQQEFGADFFRAHPDFNDGWVNRQTIGVLRGIVRYKLGQLMAEQPFDEKKIRKIIETDYTQNEESNTLQEEEDGEDEEDAGELDEANVAEEEDGAEMDDHISDELAASDSFLMKDDEATLVGNLNKLDSTASKKLASLVGFIKQDSLEHQ